MSDLRFLGEQTRRRPRRNSFTRKTVLDRLAVVYGSTELRSAIGPQIRSLTRKSSLRRLKTCQIGN